MTATGVTTWPYLLKSHCRGSPQEGCELNQNRKIPSEVSSREREREKKSIRRQTKKNRYRNGWLVDAQTKCSNTRTQYSHSASVHEQKKNIVLTTRDHKHRKKNMYLSNYSSLRSLVVVHRARYGNPNITNTLQMYILCSPFINTYRISVLKKTRRNLTEKKE